MHAKTLCKEKGISDRGALDYFYQNEIAARKIQVRCVGKIENENDIKAVNWTKEFII